MTRYRIYTLDDQGSLDFPEELDANNDRQALEAAQQKKFRRCEIWEGRRLVASLDDHRLTG
jgi:hypothetical protein